MQLSADSSSGSASPSPSRIAERQAPSRSCPQPMLPRRAWPGAVGAAGTMRSPGPRRSCADPIALLMGVQQRLVDLGQVQHGALTSRRSPETGARAPVRTDRFHHRRSGGIGDAQQAVRALLGVRHDVRDEGVRAGPSGRTSSTNPPCAGNRPRTSRAACAGEQLVGALPVDGVELATDDMERRPDVRPGGEDPDAHPLANGGGQRLVVVLHG